VGLLQWAQRELGGADQLVRKVGLGKGVREVSVSDFAARLTALGFEGDAVMCAVRAARTEGGTHITAEALHAILSTDKKKMLHADGPQTTTLSNLSKTSSLSVLGRVPKDKPVVHEKRWSPHLINTSEVNSSKSKFNRTYFGYHAPMAREDKAKFNPPRRAGGYQASKVPERPGWDSSGVAPESCKTTQVCRRYFSDVTDKPIRDQIRSSLANRRAQSASNLGEGEYPAEENWQGDYWDYGDYGEPNGTQWDGSWY